MLDPASPALRRQDGRDTSIPWDVIIFRRSIAPDAHIEVTIKRSVLARAFARRATKNQKRRSASADGAITAVIVDGPIAEAV
jgi:hypothetical protein